MKWHELELRAVYAKTLCELIETDPNVFCLEADLSRASGTFAEVRKLYPKNFINVGVAEANMICVGAGLANAGKIPFCASFACFASRRVYDQITISVAYANNNVKIVGTAPGITQGPNGGTHMCFQDLAIMRVMPNLHVYSPADAYELRSVLRYMAGSRSPTYLQLIRSRLGPLFDESYVFNPSQAVRLHAGEEVTLVATGYMTQLALEAARRLEATGVSVDVLHYPSVKPFDVATLVESAARTGAVVTVENQSILGGLGGTVCEALSENCPTRVRRLGIPDRFGEVASAEYLLHKHGFGLEYIVAACRDLVARKPREALA